MIVGLALFMLFWVWVTVKVSEIFYRKVCSDNGLAEILFTIAVGIAPVVGFIQYLDSTGQLKS
jgi:uncharacterized membrane protein YwzB